jgi:hypothetical protein
MLEEATKLLDKSTQLADIYTLLKRSVESI